MNNYSEYNNNKKLTGEQLKPGTGGGGMTPIFEQIEKDNEEDEKIINTNTKKIYTKK